jgi:hypothetical protein
MAHLKLSGRIGLFFLYIFLCSFFVKNNVYGQLRIAPPTLLLDDGNQTDRFVIHNSSYNPVEIELELMYGYQHTNEKGETYFKSYSEVPEDEPSALEWVRMYPRFFILQPGEEQIVRMAARPPAGLPAGEYWARPVILSQQPVNFQNETSVQNISARVNMQRRDVLSLTYRRGQVQTGIVIDHLTAEARDAEVVLTAEIIRNGNASYVGDATSKIYDSSGNLIASDDRRIAVYKSQKRAFRIPVNDLPAGEYTANLEFSTNNITSNRAIQAESVLQSVSFIIP